MQLISFSSPLTTKFRKMNALLLDPHMNEVETFAFHSIFSLQKTHARLKVKHQKKKTNQDKKKRIGGNCSVLRVTSNDQTRTMTTSTTPTSQYNNSFSNSNNIALQSDSYSNYLCDIYNQRVLFETASTTTTSTTFANLTTRMVSSCSATDLLVPPNVHTLNALPTFKSDLLLTDTSLFSVYHFIKTFIG